MLIRHEEAADVPIVRAVNLAAFGSPIEANIVDALRSAAVRTLSLVAEDAGEIAGHIMFSPVDVAGAADLNAMALAPMAVTPARQRTGIGSALVRAGLAECRSAGVHAIFVVGHPTYYPRFGFQSASRA